MSQKLAGSFEIKSNGTVIKAVGDFTFTHGGDIREALVSSREVDGFASKPSVPGIKGQMRDFSNVNAKEDIFNITEALITIKGGNGKTYVLESAWYSGNREVGFEQGTLNYEFQGKRSDELI